MTDNSQNQVVRIPNLPLDKMVDDQGRATPSEMTFRQTLISNLQTLFGNEGCVVPVQSPTDVALIQNNFVVNQNTMQKQYTCQLGTILYSQHPTNYTMDKVLIAVRNDNTYPSTPPLFKTVTLT
jgi:hypothetical protein